MTATAAQIAMAYPATGLALAQKIVDVSNKLGLPDPALLANAINFESGYTFSPSAVNPNGGATGLIQFYPRKPDGHANDAVGNNMGVTTSQLARMSAVDQMDYVLRYFAPYAGKLKTVEDISMAIYWPAAIGKGPNYTFPESTWAQNPGIRTVSDYVGKVMSRARLTPMTETALVFGEGAAITGTLAMMALAVGAFFWWRHRSRR